MRFSFFLRLMVGLLTVVGSCTNISWAGVSNHGVIERESSIQKEKMERWSFEDEKSDDVQHASKQDTSGVIQRSLEDVDESVELIKQTVENRKSEISEINVKTKFKNAGQLVPASVETDKNQVQDNKNKSQAATKQAKIKTTIAPPSEQANQQAVVSKKAESPKTENAAMDLAQILAKIKDMEARFQQQTIDEKGNGSQFSRGKMALQRPNSFRWEILKPFPQLIVSDAVHVWVYDQELEQVTIQKIVNQQGMSPAMVLTSDAETLERRFIVKKVATKNRTLYTLEPKGKDSLFDKLQLTFENRKIRSIMMWDVMGSKTSIQFTKVWMNVELDKRIFEFSIPKGVDVISDEQ